MFSTALLGLAGFLVVARKFDRTVPGTLIFQSYLSLGALAVFYCDGLVFHQAAEARPYALWNSLWFLALCLILAEAPKVWLGTVLVLMAATATASFFQVAALAAAGALRDFSGKRPWRETLLDGLKVYALPAAIAVTYTLRGEKWEYGGPEWGTWTMFFSFWFRRSAPAWIFAGAAAVWTWLRPNLRRYAPAPTAIVLLLLTAPGVYWITRQRGFFFSPKQYMYLSAAPAVALLILALSAPAWAAQRSRRILASALCLSMVLASFGWVASKRGPAPGTWTMEPLQAGSLFRQFLEGERPAALRCEPDVLRSFSGNLQLVAEWIPVAYPASPRGRMEVWFRAHAGIVEVMVAEPGALPEGLERIPVP